MKTLIFGILGITFFLVTPAPIVGQTLKPIVTRYGELTSSRDGSMLFRGKEVPPYGVAFDGSFSSKPLATFRVGKSDIVLMLQGMGNSCPGNFVFVTVTVKGAKASRNFGTCYDEHSEPVQLGQRITLTMPNLSRKGKSTFTFINGVVSKNGKPI